MRTIFLASTSRYRRELLQRLGLAFQVAAPDCDETVRAGESAEQLVARLAASKAASIVAQAGDALIIGSDQVAVLDSEILGKPHRHDVAVAQLTRASGREVQFLTGLCVLDAASGERSVDVVRFGVQLRHLQAAEIERYIAIEQPLDCAGSFKSEALGITLFARLRGDDPTALVGLPLIRLCAMLRAHGLSLP